MTTNNNQCPDCCSALTEKSNFCCCGWIKKEMTTENKKSNYQCAFTVNEKRCPLEGTSSPHRYGKIWYCKRHSQTLGDLKKAIEELNYIEQHFQQILNDEYISWKQELLNKNRK